MAIELNTDGNTQTATTGDTAINNSGIYNATLLGATFLWCAGFFGAYVAFTRVVTGVTIDIQTPLSISIFGGFRFVVQGGACYTVSKIQELNAKADVMTKITTLQELLSSQTQIIDTRTQTITELTQKVDTIIRFLGQEQTNGETSTEEWAIRKSITSGNYSLDCDEGVMISVAGSGISFTPSNLEITADMIGLD